jgi:hypothetical protein
VLDESEECSSEKELQEHSLDEHMFLEIPSGTIAISSYDSTALTANLDWALIDFLKSLEFLPNIAFFSDVVSDFDNHLAETEN